MTYQEANLRTAQQDYAGANISNSTQATYYCGDKYRKAVEIVKFLHDSGLVVVNTVPLFIELVDKIADIL